MVDYYKELSILKTASLDEIQEMLAKLRNTWENRRMSGNETAEKKLILLIDAEKVFKNETNRGQYDHELETAGRKPTATDSGVERKANFSKWFSQASDFLSNQQYDLAKSAIDRAFQYRETDDENALFYLRSAEIYRVNGDFRSALTFINEAIILDSLNPWNYICKSLIFEGLDNHYNADRFNFSIERRKPLLDDALRCAQTNNDSAAIGTSLGLLAHAWYRFDNKDITKAENYAHEAIKYLPQETNAKAVIDDINRQNEIRKQAEEAEILRLQKIEEATQQRIDSIKYFTNTHCSPLSVGLESAGGKIVVVTPNIFAAEFQRTDKQLIVVTGGKKASFFRKGEVYGYELSTGEARAFSYDEIIGEIKPEFMPKWAKDRMAKIKNK